jgi:LysR family transcriptional regulator, transcriptional activator of nhaA
MNFNHLHYFYMVVRHGSISAAARDLKVSQPSLSSQIKTFEGCLGVNLFDRRGNKLELTPTGKTVYSTAAQMFELSASISEFLNSSTHQNLPIRLGIADEIERPFAVRLVKNLTSKWKRRDPPSISFTTGISESLIEKLRSWSVDAVITNRPSSFEDLEYAGTLVLPIFFAISGNSDFKSKNAVSCSTKDIPKLLKGIGKGLSLPSPRLKLRAEIDSFMSKEKESPTIAFESDTLATIIRAIIDNIGVGFVPLAYISTEVVKGEVIIFGPKEGLWKHTLFLMIKKGRASAPGVSEIMQAFEDLKNEVAVSSEKVSFTPGLESFLKQLKGS